MIQGSNHELHTMKSPILNWDSHQITTGILENYMKLGFPLDPYLIGISIF